MDKLIVTDLKEYWWTLNQHADMMAAYREEDLAEGRAEGLFNLACDEDVPA